jgi:hypothetical protein
VSETPDPLQGVSPGVTEEQRSWRAAYLEALQASGVQRITAALDVAEGAMFQRWQELHGQPGDVQERAQLQEASEEMLRIRTEKLAWPKPGATLAS